MVHRNSPKKQSKKKHKQQLQKKKIIINHLENANSQTTVKYYLISIKIIRIKIMIGHQAWQSMTVNLTFRGPEIAVSLRIAWAM